MAGIASIAVMAPTVIRVFMTILLGKYEQGYLATIDCKEHDNLVRIKKCACA
jgi:hypothetical protein